MTTPIFPPVASASSDPTPGRVGVSSGGAAGDLSPAQTMSIQIREPAPGAAEAVAGTSSRRFTNQRTCRRCGHAWTVGRWDTAHVCPQCLDEERASIRRGDMS